MTELTIVSTVVGIVGSVCAIIFAYMAFSRNKRQDSTSVGEKNGTILTEIGYIRSGIDDIKSEQREQRRTNTEFVSRLTAVEESNRQAHKRLEHVEHQIEHYHLDNN